MECIFQRQRHGWRASNCPSPAQRSTKGHIFSMASPNNITDASGYLYWRKGIRTKVVPCHHLHLLTGDWICGRASKKLLMSLQEEFFFFFFCFLANVKYKRPNQKICKVHKKPSRMHLLYLVVLRFHYSQDHGTQLVPSQCFVLFHWSGMFVTPSFKKLNSTFTLFTMKNAMFYKP